MRVGMEHCDDKCTELSDTCVLEDCNDKGMVHCDEKGITHCDDKRHGAL